MNEAIQQQLDKFDKDFLPEEVIYNPDRVKSFLTQALTETWNASRKDTVERTRLEVVQFSDGLCFHDNDFSCDNGCNEGYNSAVADQHELINKLEIKQDSDLR